MNEKQNKGADIFAKLLSFFLLPNFLVCYPAAFSGIGRVYRGEHIDWEFYPILLIGVMPLVLSVTYWRMLKTNEIFVIGRKQRIIPFLLSFAGTCLTLYLAFANGGNSFWYNIYYFFLFVSVLGFLVTLFWKISLHVLATSAIGAAIVMMIAPDNTGQAVLAGLGLMIPVVLAAWARMRLKSHDWPQIAAGFILGIVSPALFKMLVYWKLLPFIK